MIDLRTEKVLNALKIFCRDGRYVVVSAKEVTEKSGVAESEVYSCIKKLDQIELISLKYAEDGEFCYCVLKDGLDYCSIKESSFFARNRQHIVFCILVLVCSFIGSLIAGFIK